MRRAEGALEWLDRPIPAADRRASLADIARLSAWFGGYWLTWSAVRALVAREPVDRPVLVVDVGGGRGDLAARLVRWARRAGRGVHVLVVDREADLLADVARVAGPAVGVVQADATALPFRASSVDVVTTTLTLHHLPPTAATQCLREMRRAARLGIVVNDLLRARLALVLVWLATHLFARHPYPRHDGPLSVRRAYAPHEVEALARAAGMTRLTIRRYPLLGRLLAVAE